MAAVLAIAVTLAGCGRSESFRYKLTLAVNTPDGVKRASTVNEWSFWEVSIPERGTAHKVRGEALYLDLGPGTRPLIALLTRHLQQHPGAGILDWLPSHDVRVRLYGPPLPNFMDEIARLADMRGPRRIAPSDLPDLVTFATLGDPKSVIKVDPDDLQATLGQGITWNEITFEMTDEAVTSGIIEAKLPWLPYHGMLDGNPLHDKSTLANALSTADFHQTDPAKSNNASWVDLLLGALRIVLR